MLVEDKILPEIRCHIKYKELCAPQQALVDNFMLFVFGYEVDGGTDPNNTNFQNMLAYVGGFFLIRCNCNFICRGCPGHSYFNTLERARPLFYLVFANHSCSIDPDTPFWLHKILQGCASMNQVRMSIADHDDKLVKAIEFKNNNLMFNGDSDNNDSSDEEEGKESETEVAYYPEIPVQGAKRRKFVKWNG